MPRKSQTNHSKREMVSKSKTEMDGGMWPFDSTVSVEQAEKAVEQAEIQLAKAQEQLKSAKEAKAANPPAPAPAAASSGWLSSFKWPSFGSKPVEVPAPAQAPAQPNQPNQLGGKRRGSAKKSRRNH
jgi:hypothetical protein